MSTNQNNSTEKLLRYKKEMNTLQSELDQEKGSLTTVLNSLKETLDLKKGNQKEIEKKAQLTIKKLKNEVDELIDVFDELMEEIEEELGEE